MKKIFIFVSTLVLLFVLVGCKKDNSKEIRVAVSFYPMNEILDLIKDDVKKDGFNLTYTNFNGDYIIPNKALQNKEFDANMIQHKMFMDNFNKGNSGTLVHALDIYHATFALYSTNNTAINDIEDKARIAIPNDSTNTARALFLLQDAGLITLKEGVTTPSQDDILTNPKNLEFIEVSLATISQVYKTDTHYAVMYPTNATNINLEGDDQRIFYEDKEIERVKDFAISLVAREDNIKSEKLEILIKHLKTDKVKDFITANYGWASTPLLK